MSDIALPLLITSIAGFSTMIGGLFVFFKISEAKINKFIVFCLAFSLTIMIGISITDLIPNSFISLLKNYSIYSSIIISIVMLLIGFLLILFMCFLIKKSEKIDLYRLGILNMLVLMLHNLPEGIATFISSYNDLEMGIKLSLSIMLHNIPEGISIAVPIYYGTKSKSKALFMTFLSGFAEPIGGILAYIVLRNVISNVLIDIILLIVAGIMITLSIEELLPKSLEYKENKFIYCGMGVGIVLLIISMFIL